MRYLVHFRRSGLTLEEHGNIMLKQWRDMNNTNPITNNAEINYPPCTKSQHFCFSGSIKELDLVWLRKGWEPCVKRKCTPTWETLTPTWKTVKNEESHWKQLWNLCRIITSDPLSTYNNGTRTSKSTCLKPARGPTWTTTDQHGHLLPCRI